MPCATKPLDTQFSTGSSKHPKLPRQQRICAIWANALSWTFQGWLAMFFAGAGYAKLTAPHDHMTLLLGWPAHVSTATLHGIGALEVVLAATMLAPLWSQGRRVMIIGAVGLIGLQALALFIHASQADLGLALINVILLGLTTTVLALYRRHE